LSIFPRPPTLLKGPPLDSAWILRFEIGGKRGYFEFRVLETFDYSFVNYL
jgi:hypothetical protein